MAIYRLAPVAAPIANGIRIYAEDGEVYAQPVRVEGDLTETAIGLPVSANTNDPQGFGVQISGADVVFPGSTSTGGALGANGQSWYWVLADLGITLPAGPLRITSRITASGFADGAARADPQPYCMIGMGTGPTAPLRAHGFHRPPTGTSINYGYLIAAGGGSATNSTGAATMTANENSQMYGDASTWNYFLTRYDGTDPVSTNTGLTGPSVSSKPTHVALWAMIDAGTMTVDWTVSDVSVLIRW